MPNKGPQLAKLTRPRLYGAVARERLFLKLSEQRKHRPAICVVGPPGSGKTTLVASWLDANNNSGIWYQIDVGDTDLPTFFYYLSQSAQRFTRSSQRPLPLLTPEYLANLEGFARRFFRAFFSRLPQGGTVVLDNYQEVGPEARFHLVVASAIAETPVGITLVIISRQDPPDCYARLVANENVAVVDWKDLQLTLDEGLAIAGKRVAADVQTIARLYAQSDGWAAGFILLLEGLRRAESSSDVTEADSLRTVFNYFAGQLFDQTSPEAQRNLLHLSFLPQIAESAATELLGESALPLLEDLHRRHLFTDRRKAGEAVYQFHGLFRAFLQHRAAHTLSLLEQAAVSRRAARVLENSGHPEDALPLYLFADEPQSCERIILQEAARLIGQGRWKVVVDWIGCLPKERVNASHWLTHWLGIAKLAVEPGEARTVLEASYELAVCANDMLCQAQVASAIIQTYMLQYTHFRPLDRWIDALNRALHAEVAFPSLSVELRTQSALLIALAYRQPWHPALASCVERVFELVQTAVDANLRAIGAAYLLGYGATTGPTSVSRRALPVLEALLLHPDVTPLNRAWSCFLISWFHCVSGNFDQAFRAAKEIERLGTEHDLPHVQKFALIISAWRGLFKVDPSAAWEWIERLTPMQAFTRLYDTATYHVTIGWYYVVVGRASTAMEHYRIGLPLFDETGSVMHRVIYRFYMSFALTLCGQFAAAQQVITEAREIAGKGLTTWQACALYAAEAYAALEAGDRQKAFEALSNRFRCGRVNGEEHGVVHVFSQFMPRLCAAALEQDIEIKYVQSMIREHGWEAPSAGSENWPWRVRVYTLGEFHVLVEDKALRFHHKTPRKPLTLLKVLIALGKVGVPEQKLIDVLWPEEEGDAARSAYKVALHRLRGLVGENAILIEAGIVSLNVKSCWVDSWEMERLVASTGELLSHPDLGGLLELTEKAARLYRGAFLAADSDAQWAVSARERLRGRFIHLVEAVGKRFEAEHRWDQAIDWYLRGLQADDLSESFYQGLMRCYHQTNRRSEALSVFRRMRQTLSVTLGIAPSERSESLYRTLVDATDPDTTRAE
jgi:LuxR family transcriptional regulator, maltose regulon positive regulatory protein